MYNLLRDALRRKLFLLMSFILIPAMASTNIALADFIEVPIAADAEEHGDWDWGAMEDLDSSDLEMPYEDSGMGEKQTTGLLFADINIPKGATINAAWVQFQVDETKDGTLPVNLIIEGELSANAAVFTSDDFNITNRARTTTEVQWSVPNWSIVGERGPGQTTSNISAIIQEIVNQEGWASGNALALIISDNPVYPSSGIRCAVAEPGDGAPFLYVDFSVDPAALPKGWQSRDIGTIGGSAAEIDGLWVVNGDGADIWGEHDEFHYAFTTLSGDGTIVARVLDNGIGSDMWAKGGVMIRETLEVDSKHAMMFVSGGSGSGKAFQYRPITGQRSMSAHGGDQVYPPMWVKLTRIGNIITGYYSFDGVNWIEQENLNLDEDIAGFNPATIEMATDVYIGLFVTSHRSGEIRAYTFDNVRVTEIPKAGSGANIIVVTEAADTNLDGMQDDHELIDWLVDEGHNVDVRRDNWMTLNSEKIAELNEADLIIVSRLTDSLFYSFDEQPTQWNSVTTPLIQMNPYFARNNRWKWVNSETVISDGPDIFAEVVDFNYLLLRGVPVTMPDEIDPNNPVFIVQVVEPFIGTGTTSFIGTSDMGNGRLIAKPAGSDMGWIAEWDAGEEFYQGSGQFAGGKRILFCAGTKDIDGTRKGRFNLTTEGRQIFRNAIRYMLGGADIILVTEEIDWNMDGLRDDHALESFLVAEGHRVDVRPDYWKNLSPEKIDELNAADLIIFSRSAWSNNYSEDNETTEWNSLETPTLQMNPFFARNSRWNWVNTDTATEGSPDIFAEVIDFNHPVFREVPLRVFDPISPDAPANVVQIFDPLIGSGQSSFIGTTNMGNGYLIAKPVELNMAWIAEWDAGVEFYAGSGQYAGGKRMLFCAGTQEIQYYDDVRRETITSTQGELNLTAEGLQIFRNAIDYLLSPQFRREIFYWDDLPIIDGRVVVDIP